MIEELPDDIENDIDDIEPVGEEADAQLYEHFRVVVDKGQAMMRVDKYLFERIVNASRNRIQKAAEDGLVRANGKPVKSSYKVKPLDVITVMMDRPRYENEIIPEDIPLDIVYEDKYVMVVNKPPGLVVHPGHGNYHGTLVNALARSFISSRFAQRHKRRSAPGNSPPYRQGYFRIAGHCKNTGCENESRNPVF